MVSFKAGINLGGWISQYQVFSKEHFDTFITEKDIETIAEAGFDHVRRLLIIQLSSLMTMWENIKKMGFLILTGALSGVKNTIWGLCWICITLPGTAFRF